MSFVCVNQNTTNVCANDARKYAADFRAISQPAKKQHTARNTGNHQRQQKTSGGLRTASEIDSQRYQMHQRDSHEMQQKNPATESQTILILWGTPH